VHGDELQSTVYSEDDYAIGLSARPNTGGLTFAPGDGVVCFVNSTELWRIVVGSKVMMLGEGEVRLSREVVFTQMAWCR